MEPKASKKAAWSEPGFYDNIIQKYANLQGFEKVQMKSLMEQGLQVTSRPALVQENAQSLNKELTSRLAKRLLDIQFLPYIVAINPNIKRVYEAYYSAFQTLRNFPEIKDSSSNADFTQLLKRLVDEHSPLVESLAAGLRECKSKPIIGEQLQLDEFLNNMLTSRISRRVLAEQHIALQQKRQNFVGIINTNLCLKEAVRFAFMRAQQVCIETYGISPKMSLRGDEGAIISYIPTHLDYMLFELLKNAMRATVERVIGGSKATRSRNGNGNGGRNRSSDLSDMPAVVVKICKGGDQVTIKICDQGGGIAETEEKKIWKYGYTTVSEIPVINQMEDSQEEKSFENLMSGASNTKAKNNCMAGLGFGLPLSRLHARYFGGDLELINLRGFGTDAYLFLKLHDDLHG
jgi:[3-methyl-2-oxobutanoate dehydrogenase (acetyl-transferring)] kinase